MVNSKHSLKLKSTPKKGLRSNSRNMNGSQATPITSGTNEAEKPLNKHIRISNKHIPRLKLYA